MHAKIIKGDRGEATHIRVLGCCNGNSLVESKSRGGVQWLAEVLAEGIELPESLTEFVGMVLGWPKRDGLA